MDPAVDPSSWGIDVGYHDAGGTWREPPPDVLDAVAAAMGASGRSPHDAAGLAMTVRLDHELPALGPGRLVLEDGTGLELGAGDDRAGGRLPPDLPLGYHRFFPADGGPPRRLVASPGRCPVPASATWGWASQLYATRSEQSWGMGDLADLRRLAAWSAGQGAGMVLLNPLHAAPPGPHQEPSPYFAGSRCFTSPLYLRVEEIPGATALLGLAELAAAGRALNADRLIDRDLVWALKSAALEALYAGFDGDAGFDRFVAERGASLQGFATYSALAEVHGSWWPGWPVELRFPESPAVVAWARAPGPARRVRYHAWLQWHLDRQLHAASETLGLVQDLAIGVGPGAADAWLWQETFASGMRVGAPPDDFNTLGQDWGLPPWDPWKLRRADYEPFVQTVRAALRHAGGMRFDHVMGLFRLFWIPEGRPPREGTYVRYPYWDLLNILALEAHRAGAYVAGEDLGTVEDYVRHELAQRGVLSYRLAWFETDPPRQWPAQSIGAVTTHDLPTIAGVWTGHDLDAQRRLGLAPNEEGAAAMRRRLSDPAGTPVGEVIEHAYQELATSPSLVLAATLDDALAVEERPNMPGTTVEWPSWCLALPAPLEVLEKAPLPARIARHLARAAVPAEP